MDPTIIDALREFYEHYDSENVPDDETLAGMAERAIGKEKQMWDELYRYYDPSNELTEEHYNHLLSLENPLKKKEEGGFWDVPEISVPESGITSLPADAPIVAEDSESVPPGVEETPFIAEGIPDIDWTDPVKAMETLSKIPAAEVPTKEKVSTLNRLNSYLGSFEKGMINEFLAKGLKGGGELQAWLMNPVSKAIFDEPFSAKDSWLYQAGQSIESTANNILYENEELKEELGSQIARGVGQAAGFIATAPKGAAQNLPGVINTTKNALNIASQKAFTVPAVAGMLATVGSEVEQARQEYERVQGMDKEEYLIEKTQEGASVEDADEMYDRLTSMNEHELVSQILPSAMASGSTEFIPISAMFTRMDKASGGTFSQLVFKKIKDGTMNVVEGGLQEAVQQVISNFTAQEVYDLTTGISDDVVEAAEVGAGTQAVLNILLTAITGRKSRTGNIQDQKKLDEAKKHIEQKEDVVADKVANRIQGQEEVAPTEKSPEATPQEQPVTLEQRLGQPVQYRGRKGLLQQNEEGEIVVATSNQEIVVEDSNKDLTKTMEEVDIEKSTTVEVDEMNVTVDGKKYGFVSVNQNDKGELVSVTVDDAGKPKTIRDPGLALKLDIERNKIPEQYQLEVSEEVTPETVAAEQERLSNDVAAAIGEDPSIDLGQTEIKAINDILDRTQVEEVAIALDGDMESLSDEGREIVSMWAEESISSIEELGYESEYAKQMVNNLNNVIQTIEDYDTYKSESTLNESKYVERAERGLDEEVLSRAIEYDEGTSVEGVRDERVIPTGERIPGKWKVVSADDITPSHDEENFTMSIGFPTVGDKTANDRNYETDPVAQGQVIDMAANFDERALQDPIMVSEEGIVMSGNNRSMSRRRAAKQGTDTKYLEGLKREAEAKGISPEDIEGINNPTLVFEIEGPQDYNTASFAKFNVSEKKAKSEVDKAVTIARSLPDRVRDALNEKIATHENLSEFHKSKKSVREAINMMVDAGAIPAHELNDYYDQTTGTLTQTGKDFFETALLTGTVSEDALRLLNQHGLRNIRQKLVKAIVPLAESSTHGKDYELSGAVDEAIRIHNEALSSEQSIEEFTRQIDMFGEGAAKYSPDGILMAHLLNLTQNTFLAKVKQYNQAAATGSGMFAELSSNQQEILQKLTNATDETASATNKPTGRKATKRPSRKRKRKAREPKSEGGTDTPATIVDKAKAGKDKDTLSTGSPNGQNFGFFNDSVMGFNVNVQFDKMKNLFRKFFTAKGYLPSEVFEEKVKRDARMNRVQREIRQTAEKFKKAVRKTYGRVPDGPTINRMDLALKGDQEALASLPEDIQEILTSMRRQIDIMSQELRDMGFVDGHLEDVITDNLGVYVTRTYRKHNDPDWVKNIPPDVWNRAAEKVEQAVQEEIDKLEEKAVLTPNQQERLDYFKEQIEDIDGLVEFLVIEPPESLGEGGKLGSKNLDILKERKDIDEEIRALYGEYKDPLLNYAMSLTKLGRLIHNHRFLERVVAIGEGKFLFKTKKKGYSTPLGAKAWGPKNAESGSWDPLANFHTSPEIAEALFQEKDAPITTEWLRHIVAAGSVVKYVKTIGSVPTHGRNITGNFIFMARNGHFGHTAPKIKILFDEAFRTGQMSEENLEYINRAIETGVLYDTPHFGELRAMMKDIHKGEMLDLPQMGEMITLSAKQILKKGRVLLEKAYQFEDDMFKINAWEIEKKRYAEALHGKKLEELNPDELRDIEERAARIVRRIYPTYSFVPRAVRELRRIPFVGTFVSFPSEVIRSTAANISLIREEINDPKLKKLGYKRAAWFSTAAVIPTITAFAAKALMGAWDDEDAEENYRVWLPPWSKNSEVIYLSPVDEKGSFTYIDMGQMDPHALFKKPIYEFIYNENDRSLFKTSMDAMGELLKPFLGEDILFRYIDEAVNNKKRSGAKIYETNDTIEDKLAKSFQHITGAFEPGTVRQVRRIIKSYYQEDIGEVSKLKPEVEWMAALGVRVSRPNVVNAYGFEAYKWSQAKADSKKIFYKELYRQTGPRPSENSKDFKTRRKTEIRQALESSELYYNRLMDDVVFKTEAALNMGVSKKKLFQLLTANRRFTREEALFIISGKKPKFKVKPQKF